MREIGRRSCGRALREETKFTSSPSSGNRKCSIKDLIKEPHKLTFRVIREEGLKPRHYRKKCWGGRGPTLQKLLL